MELFTYDFTVENGDFDPSVIVKGDVKGIYICVNLLLCSKPFAEYLLNFSDCDF